MGGTKYQPEKNKKTRVGTNADGKEETKRWCIWSGRKGLASPTQCSSSPTPCISSPGSRVYVGGAKCQQEKKPKKLEQEQTWKESRKQGAGVLGPVACSWPRLPTI